MAKVSEVVTILKKQADLIGKLRSEKADLLAALRALVEQYGDPKYMPDAPGWAEARAAIAKAEGK